MTFRLGTINYLLITVVALLSLFSNSEKLLSYAVLFVYLTLFFIFCATKQKLLRFPRYSFCGYLPLFCLLTWFYGFVLGLSSDFPIEATISNFAGMIFYIFYYMIYLAAQKSNDILRVLTKVALGYSVYLLITMGSNLDHIQPDAFSEIGLSAIRVGWSSTLSLSLLLVGLGFSDLIGLNGRNHYNAEPKRSGVFSALLICLGAIPIILAASKGFIFSLALLFLMLLSFKTFDGLLRLRIGRKVIYCFVVLMVVVTSWSDEIAFVTRVLVDLESNVNHSRSEQAIELIGDFGFFGHGLGAGLSTGYTRDILGYGFELSFHNIIHKFGIFSIFPFMVMVIPVILAIIGILRGKHLMLNIAALSLMLYIIPGYGNPIVYAPLNVLINCMALYFVLNPESTMSAFIRPRKAIIPVR